MVTDSGVSGVTEGGAGGTTACPVVCLDEGRCAGVCDGARAGRRDALADGLAFGDALTCALWLSEARCDDPVEESVSIGTTMRSPTTTNTAAIAARDSDIASPGGPMIYAVILPITHPPRGRNGTTGRSRVAAVARRSMMRGMDDGLTAGRLLVATPQLADPNFRRTVVLIVEHEVEGGTLGVVLNRPTEVPVDRVLPPWSRLVTGPSVVFQGGPVALDSALALAQVPGTDEPLGWRALNGTPAVARVGLVDLDAPPELLAPEVARLRVFAGYAGWAAGQLASEIEEGAWYVLPAESGDVFIDDPGRLWPAVLRRQGGELAFVSTFPDDPSLN